MMKVILNSSLRLEGRSYFYIWWWRLSQCWHHHQDRSSWFNGRRKLTWFSSSHWRSTYSWLSESWAKTISPGWCTDSVLHALPDGLAWYSVSLLIETFSCTGPHRILAVLNRLLMRSLRHSALKGRPSGSTKTSCCFGCLADRVTRPSWMVAFLFFFDSPFCMVEC